MGVILAIFDRMPEETFLQAYIGHIYMLDLNVN